MSLIKLVVAQCTAGIVGSFPALNARPPELLDTWLTRIRDELAAWDNRASRSPGRAVCGDRACAHCSDTPG